MSVCPSVCLFVCVLDNAKNNGSINLKIKHTEVYEDGSDKFHNGQYSYHGQGHSKTLSYFSIYHNTKCQVLYLSFE